MKPSFAAILTVLLCADLCAADRPLTLAEKIQMARNMAEEAATGKAEAGRVVTGDFDFQAEFRKYRAAHPAPESRQLPEEADITSSSKTTVSAKDETTRAASALSAKNNKSQSENRPPSFPTKSAENPSPPKPEYAVDSSNFVRGHYMGTVGAKKEEITEIKESHKKLDKLDSENKGKIFTYSNSMFEIASDDYAAHAMMIAVADEFANAFSEYFSDGKMTFGGKILIQAVAKDAEKAARPFAFSAGDATVSVAWRRDLSLESFCRFMSAATLRKMLREIKPASEGGVPLWIELATAQAFEQAVRLGAAAQAAR